jgi:hypothetical protein
MKIYIVSGRIDTDVLYPRVFKTREEAEQEVKDIIFEAARQCYQYEDDAEDNPDWGTLENWACENGYEFYFEFLENRGVFYDGREYTEAEITEHEI